MLFPSLKDRESFLEPNIADNSQQSRDKEIAAVMVEAALFSKLKVELFRLAGESAGDDPTRLERAYKIITGILNSQKYKEIEEKYFGPEGFSKQASENFKEQVSSGFQKGLCDKLVPKADMYTNAKDFAAFKKSLDEIKKACEALKNFTPDGRLELKSAVDHQLTAEIIAMSIFSSRPENIGVFAALAPKIEVVPKKSDLGTHIKKTMMETFTWIARDSLSEGNVGKIMNVTIGLGLASFLAPSLTTFFIGYVVMIAMWCIGGAIGKLAQKADLSRQANPNKEESVMGQKIAEVVNENHNATDAERCQEFLKNTQVSSLIKALVQTEVELGEGKGKADKVAGVYHKAKGILKEQGIRIGEQVIKAVKRDEVDEIKSTKSGIGR